ncbi:MAG: hypothetical protein EOO75_17560, partial [Myxococcales bacterium]
MTPPDDLLPLGLALGLLVLVALGLGVASLFGRQPAARSGAGRRSAHAPPRALDEPDEARQLAEAEQLVRVQQLAIHRH